MPYLNIQKNRPEDRLLYELDLPSDLEDFLIPRLILQPLIENAIIHGILPSGRSGRITVRTRQEGSRLVLSVQDNGDGMEPMQLQQLRQLLQIDQRRLTPAEEKYLVSWIRMGFRDDTIRMAYERTCLNTGALKWAYMNSILTSWHEQNLHTPEEILAGDAPRKPEQRRASAYQQHDAALSPLAQEAVARMLAEEDD